MSGEFLNRGELNSEELNFGDAASTRQPEGPGRGQTRFGLWNTVNWFVLPHVDLRVDLVLRQDRPTVLQSQIHFYL